MAEPQHSVASTPASQSPRRIRLRFTGDAIEYLRIWAVNLGLTVITLGIYSAWAKVRTRRYLYANLSLDGSPFEYTADPMKILIGRLIVGAGAAIYFFTAGSAPWLAITMTALFALASPWIAVRAISFNHRNTRWRNLRFRFLGSYGEAARVYLAWPLLVAATLGIAAPAYHGRRQAFLVANSAYGATRFSFQWRAGDYFAAYVLPILAFVASTAYGAGIGSRQDEQSPLMALLSLGGTLLGYFVAFAIIKAGTLNLMYRGASLPGVRFESHLRAAGLLGIYLTNALAIVLSLGLLIPWAQMRLAHYRTDRIEVWADGDLGSFVHAADEAERLGAFADEAAVAFDFDFGL